MFEFHLYCFSEYRILSRVTLSVDMLSVKNVSVSELEPIWIFDCNLAIRLIESKYLKMTKAIRIIEFQNYQKLFD
jgi:hypothetical protein